MYAWIDYDDSLCIQAKLELNRLFEKKKEPFIRTGKNLTYHENAAVTEPWLIFFEDQLNFGEIWNRNRTGNHEYKFYSYFK
jgi:hypothetical protein